MKAIVIPRATSRLRSLEARPRTLLTDGVVTEINPALNNAPETVNSAPYDAGWMLKLKLANPADANA